MRTATLYLEEAALGWYRWIVRAKGAPVSRGEFEQGLVALYRDSIAVDYQGELAKLKQKGYEYDEYQKEFMRISHMVHGLSEHFLISCFISGLRETI